MERRIEVLGAAHLELVDDVALLEPRAQVFEAMLDGWRSQQLSRNLTFSTIDAGARVVSRFRHDTEVWPWEWTPGQLERWCAELREHKLRAPSTVRSYQLAVRSFLAYVTDRSMAGTASACSALAPMRCRSPGGTTWPSTLPTTKGTHGDGR